MKMVTRTTKAEMNVLMKNAPNEIHKSYPYNNYDTEYIFLH